MNIEDFCDSWISEYATSTGTKKPKKLGCGTWGCAYRVAPRKVLKITVSSSEAEAAQWIFNGVLSEPFWPRIDKIQKLALPEKFQIEEYKNFRDFWLIWREELDDVTCDKSNWFDNLRELDMEIEKGLKRFGWNLMVKDDFIINTALALMEADPATPRDERLFEQLAEILDSCFRTHKIQIGDMGIDNVGTRKGDPDTLVIRDLGSVKKIKI